MKRYQHLGLVVVVAWLSTSLGYTPSQAESPNAAVIKTSRPATALNGSDEVLNQFFSTLPTHHRTTPHIQTTHHHPTKTFRHAQIVAPQTHHHRRPLHRSFHAAATPTPVQKETLSTIKPVDPPKTAIAEPTTAVDMHMVQTKPEALPQKPTSQAITPIQPKPLAPAIPIKATQPIQHPLQPLDEGIWSLSFWLKALATIILAISGIAAGLFAIRHAKNFLSEGPIERPTTLKGLQELAPPPEEVLIPEAISPHADKHPPQNETELPLFQESTVQATSTSVPALFSDSVRHDASAYLFKAPNTLSEAIRNTIQAKVSVTPLRPRSGKKPFVMPPSFGMTSPMGPSSGELTPLPLYSESSQAS